MSKGVNHAGKFAQAYPRNPCYWSYHRIASSKTSLPIFYSRGICTCWSISIVCPAVHRWHRDPTANDVIAAIAENFVDLGVPNRFQDLLELRNTPGETGTSSNEIVFGHNLRSIVPAHHSSYATRWKAATIERDRIAAPAAKAKFTTTQTLILWPHSR